MLLVAVTQSSSDEHQDTAVFGLVHQNVAPVAAAKSAIYDRLVECVLEL